MTTGASFVHLFVRLIINVFFLYPFNSGWRFLSRSGRERKREARLQNKGNIVTGRITHHRFYMKDLPCKLMYSYECNGKPFENTQIVHPNDFRRFTDGEDVVVRYLPADPKIAMLDQIDPSYRTSHVVRKVAWGYFIKAVLVFLFLALLVSQGYLWF